MTGLLRARPIDELAWLPHRRIMVTRRSARDLFDVLETFARRGRSPVRDIVTPSDIFTCWEHNPPVDEEGCGTGCAWYYNTHAPSYALPWDEHGHFRSFMYTEGPGRSERPIPLPLHHVCAGGGLVHLAAVSFDNAGQPIRLFIPNRWGTCEWLDPSLDVIARIDRSSIVSDQLYELTNRFLASILRLFHPKIGSALREEDRVVGDHNKKHPQGSIEDRFIHVVSCIASELDANLAALDRAWAGGISSRKDANPQELASKVD